MLVLNRKQGESVVIDEAITVKVIEITGGRAKLGFDAPLAVGIRRQEITPEKISEKESDVRLQL